MNNFTFSNPIHNSQMKDHSDEEAMENYESWAERIRGGQCNNFGQPNNVKFGAWKRRNLISEGDNDSDRTPSPELWKQNRDHRYYYDTDTPRAQSIANYRQEMLDLVRGMPETAYELSLRDLVESPKMTTPLKEEDSSRLEEGDEEAERIGKKKEKRGARRISRGESMDKGGGLMLKMMFVPKIPSVFGGKKSHGSKTKSTGAKVSPKPVLGDRGWWKDEFGEMSSSAGSSSSSNSTETGNRKLLGCYPFFQTR